MSTQRCVKITVFGKAKKSYEYPAFLYFTPHHIRYFTIVFKFVIPKMYVLDQDPCDSTPCQHNGTCLRQGYTDAFNCTCTHGFSGRFCEIGTLIKILAFLYLQL